MISDRSIDVGRFPSPEVIPYTDLFEMGEHEVIESYDSAVFDPSSCDYYEFLTRDIHFVRILGKGFHRQHFAFKSAKPFVSLLFSFKCRGVFVNRRTNKVFADIQHNQSGLTFINTQVFDNSWITESDSELYVINIEVDYFKRFLSSDNPMYETFYSSLKENNPVLLNERSIEVTLRMRSLLYDMFLFEHKSYYKTLYLKSRFIELLMLQFQEYETSCRSADATFIDQSNLVKMQEARDIINANIAKPCTLVDLAQQVGTNECYLKKHFKQAFGTTVFGYLHKQRMETSREILLSGKKKISEVAKLSGYKHASHFTSAFKKYFGYLPTQVKMLIVSFIHGPEIAAYTEMMSLVPV